MHAVLIVTGRNPVHACVISHAICERSYCSVCGLLRSEGGSQQREGCSVCRGTVDRLLALPGAASAQNPFYIVFFIAGSHRIRPGPPGRGAGLNPSYIPQLKARLSGGLEAAGRLTTAAAPSGAALGR